MKCKRCAVLIVSILVVSLFTACNNPDKTNTESIPDSQILKEDEHLSASQEEKESGKAETFDDTKEINTEEPKDRASESQDEKALSNEGDVSQPGDETAHPESAPEISGKVPAKTSTEDNNVELPELPDILYPPPGGDENELPWIRD